MRKQNATFLCTLFIFLCFAAQRLDAQEYGVKNLVTKRIKQSFCGGKKEYAWECRPTVVKEGQRTMLRIEETFIALRGESCGIAGDIRYSGPFNSIVSTTVNFADESFETVSGATIELKGRTVVRIQTENKFADVTWQFVWDEIALTGGVEILELYLEDHAGEKLSEKIMRGEAFRVALRLAHPMKDAPRFSLATKENAKISATFGEGEEWPLASDPEYVFVSNVYVLENSARGGSFPELGAELLVSCMGQTISVPIVDAKIDLRVLPSDGGFEPALASISSDQPFYVEAQLPREWVQSGRFGNEIEVRLESKKGAASDTLALQSKENLYGRVVYRNEQAATLAQGSKGSFVDYMDPIRIDPYDQLTVSLVQDPSTSIVIGAFATPTQQAISLLRERIVFLRDLFQEGMLEANISKLSREVMHRKHEAAKNALVVLDYEATNNDETWNDWKKLAIAQEYDKLLRQDASKWNRMPESSAKEKRFGFRTLWVQESKAIVSGYQGAAKRVEAALESAEKVVLEGAYRAVVTFSGAAQAYKAVFGRDEFGEPVDLTTQVLAGVELASTAILAGHNVLRAKSPRGPWVDEAKGLDAFYSNRKGTRLLDRGVRAEDWLIEVCGTGRHGGSQTTFKVGDVTRQYDAYDHVQHIAFESKTGRTKFSGLAKDEFFRDIEMLKRHAELRKVEWHFFVSEEVFRKAYAKGLRGKQLMNQCFGPVSTLLEELEKVQAELQALGKEFQFVYHERLLF